jgi:hypothetical protein
MGHNEEKKAEDKQDGFKVMDRRRFDESGNERSEGSSRSSSQADSRRANSSASPQADEEAGATSHTTALAEITFGSFIFSIAHQALMQMGEVPPPPGVDLPKDVEGARQTIDIIAMLDRKTKGNLDQEEQRLMTDVLHNLRMCFVKNIKG